MTFITVEKQLKDFREEEQRATSSKLCVRTSALGFPHSCLVDEQYLTNQTNLSEPPLPYLLKEDDDISSGFLTGML